MIYFMLNDLCRPAGVGFEPRFKSLVLILYLDRAVSFGFSCSSERQAAFLRLIRAGGFYYFRIKHDAGSAVIIEDNDSLGYTDHVCRHTYAAVPVGSQGIPQILRDRQIFKRRQCGLLGKKYGVFCNRFYHSFILSQSIDPSAPSLT